MRIMLVCRGSSYFLDPLITHWREKGYTFVDSLRSADVIFCEWGNEQSLHVTYEAIRKNVIVRMHGSEYFQGYYEQWNKEKVFAVLKANPDYTIPGVRVVDCGIPIDVDFWKEQINTPRYMKRIVMVGSFVYSKNHLGLLHILSKYPKYFKDIVFVGDINPTNDPHRTAETKKTLAQIFYYAKKYDLPVRVSDKMDNEQLRQLYNSSGYVVSNSINEGCHTVISEGVLCGCKPLIYDWIGAENIYGIEVYHNSDSFWKLVKNYPYNTQTYLKSIITDKFNKDNIYKTIDDLLFEAAREGM